MKSNKKSSVKIKENWKNIEEIEKLVQEKTGDPKAGFNANVYFFGSGGRHIMLPCKYRKPKKNGEFTDKYFEMDVMIDYCPFTGKPLYEKDDSKEESMASSKELKSLSEHNSQISHFSQSIYSNLPKPNGIGCPECGEELLDSKPMVTLPTHPPKKNVHCSKCKYQGFRLL